MKTKNIRESRLGIWYSMLNKANSMLDDLKHSPTAKLNYTKLNDIDVYIKLAKNEIAYFIKKGGK